LSPHEILRETYDLISGLNVTSMIFSDHYTNYIMVKGKMPDDRYSMLKSIKKALDLDEESYRKIYIGTE